MYYPVKFIWGTRPPKSLPPHKECNDGGGGRYDKSGDEKKQSDYAQELLFNSAKQGRQPDVVQNCKSATRDQSYIQRLINIIIT